MVLAGIALDALSATSPSSTVRPSSWANRYLLVVLYLIRRAGGGFKSKFAAAGLYTLLVLRKGGSIVRKTLLDHWELALMRQRGGVVLGRRRLAEEQELPRDGPRRHEVDPPMRRRVVLHNAFKAPAAQFVVYLVLIALYARTRVLKMTGKKTYYREEKTE